jgi:hypothetical protein
MSRIVTSGPASRPTLIDYLLLLAGAGLSLALIKLSPFSVEPSDAVTQRALRAAIPLLPRLLRLPEGVILLLPLFFATQFVLGRRDSLTAAEWLWLLSWCGTAILTVLAGCDHFNLLPELLQTNVLLIRLIWYVGFELAMALLACVLIVAGFFRPARPWTHQLALALALWPVAPLAGILALSKLFV